MAVLLWVGSDTVPDERTLSADGTVPAEGVDGEWLAVLLNQEGEVVRLSLSLSVQQRSVQLEVNTWQP